MRPVDAQRRENPRILFFFWILLGAVAVLLGGLAYRQLMSDERYARIEKRQSQRRILTPGPRGNIFDRDGKLLVGNRPHYSAVVYLDDLRREFREAYSRLLRNVRRRLPEGDYPDYEKRKWEARLSVVQRYVERVNAITGGDAEVGKQELVRHFNERLLLPLPLAEDLDQESYARLVEQVPVRSPIRIRTGTARYYPHGSLAAHTLGYVSRENPDESTLPDDGVKTFTFKTKVGRTGLERSFNERLSGTSGREIWRVDPMGFQANRLSVEPPEKGEDLYTSLDLELQQAAETALGDRTGAAVALDARTGEIRVLASHPAYDLNKLSPYIPRKVFQAIEERGAWLNRALQLSYPPGSTFKLVTAIAGMRTGALPPGDKHVCQGALRVGNRRFHCHARYGHGAIRLPRAIEVSCNVFFYGEGLETGIDAISDEARRFGMDQKTGVRVPFETDRLVVPDKAWKKEQGLGGWVPGDTANTAIGQGFLLVTPLRMASVIASIGRGETRTRPTLLALSPEEAAGVDHGGEAIGLSQRDRQRLVEGMRRVTGPEGTARLVDVEGLPVAGKTGTADFRAHGEEVNLAWFIGFAPVENPEIAVAVMVEGTESTDAYHGGSTAGPVAQDIFAAFRDQRADGLAAEN